MTGEELTLARERSTNRMYVVLIVCLLLALLALVALVAYGCREVQRCPDRFGLSEVCGVPASPACVEAMRKACK